MAGFVTSMVIGQLVSMVKDKASSYLLEQYKVMEGMEKQHKILKRQLPAIMDVITDAEEQATHREGVKAWLGELKTVAYEANEVFDELKYEALRREAKKNGHYGKLGFDVVRLFPTDNRVVFRYRMGNKLRRIVRTIEILVTEMNAFGFKYQQQTPTCKQRQQTDSIIVDPENIVSQSRYEEKQKIVKILTDPANSATLTVLPIVGMGGLGKTTLSQLIYNDLQVQKHFQIKRWICVSDDFNAYDIARKICNGPGENDNEKALHKLQQELSGKRYLLVLDDVWNQDPDKWDKLKACLQYGGIGSAILVTTRIKGVAQLMSTVEAHDIAVLEKKFITQIFKTRAFSLPHSKPAPEILNMVDAPELLNMVEKFVERCAGSPLAAKALGSVLHTKTSLEEWTAVLNKSIICTEESAILPILKLSYNDLPSDMKRCFAFCAVFPKDYVICVDKLIQLWIANGFIQEQEEVRLETIGKQIFNELASRSFFQNVKQVLDEKTQDYSRVTCEIHDLMHDVALSTMRKECATITVKPSQTQWLPESARHLFLSCRKPETILNDSLKKRWPAIQTLLCDSYMECSLQHLSKYSSVRALQLCIWRESFPLNPKYLHHLRYLDLSRSCIRALPEDITILYHLKTLNLFGCNYLDRLPSQMKYMTALCHLYTHGCRELKSMPPDLRKLTSLQTLTCFVAGTGSYCSNVRELQHLNLGGQLELLQLENVREADAKTANLINKKELVELTLRWTLGREDERQHYHKVLDGLKPHDRMQVVRIYSYRGTNFPTWMSMLQKIHLFHCNNLQCLFNHHTSFTFPKLKELTLEHLPVFERWWERNGTQGEKIIFPQLEKLFIKHCGMLIHLLQAPLLEEPCGGDYTMVCSAFPVLKVLELEYLESFKGWEATEGTQGEHVLFPRLEKLSIQKCPELTALPEAAGDHTVVRSAFPALEVLELEDLKSFQRWEAAKRTEGVIMFPHLLKLSLKKCPELTELPAAPLLGNPCAGDFNMARSAFPALMVLELGELKSFQKWQAGTVTQGEQISFPRLEKLSIKKCPELTALPAGAFQGRSFGGNDTKEWSAFPELKELQLYNLKSFQCWGVTEATHGEQLTFPNLESVLLGECPELKTLPKAPKLSVLDIKKGNKQMCQWIARYITSLTNLNLELKDTETSLAEDSLLVASKKNCKHRSPLAVMELCCNMFFHSGALTLWTCFVQLQELAIYSCNALIHWPEKEFQSLVTLRRLKIKECNSLTGYAQTPEPSTAERCQLLPRLDSLEIKNCKNLVAVFDVPASLKKMDISVCAKLESPFGKHQGKSALHEGSCSDARAPTSVSELSSSLVERSLPCLETLSLDGCASLSGVFILPASLKEIYINRCSNIQVLSCQLDGLQTLEVTASTSVSLTVRECDSLSLVLNLPMSLKKLDIRRCDRLKSLESHSGDLSSLEELKVRCCRTVASLPGGPQGPQYTSLRWLEIRYCPGIKTLPRWVQQQLGSLQEKDLDACYEGPKLLKPNTWKYAISRD